jgi:Outer membrane lipoprotein-sorting protein
MKQVKKFWVILLIALSGLPGGSWADEDPNTILDQIRSAQVSITQPLNARLRTENGVSVPIKIQFKGQEIQYEFSNPYEKLTVDLSGSTLNQESAGTQQKVTGTKLTELVRGTDVAFEDLALRFLFWRNARFEGEQRARGLTCSIILVQPSSRYTQYGSVRIWVAKDRGAMIKAEGFDNQGKLIKRFEVISAQQIEGKTIFKQIRIERLDPMTGKTLARTYLELV